MNARAVPICRTANSPGRCDFARTRLTSVKDEKEASPTDPPASATAIGEIQIR